MYHRSLVVVVVGGGGGCCSSRPPSALGSELIRTRCQSKRKVTRGKFREGPTLYTLQYVCTLPDVKNKISSRPAAIKIEPFGRERAGDLVEIGVGWNSGERESNEEKSEV